MANKSTRAKIKDQMKKAIADLDRCMEHLQSSYQLAGGGSDPMEKHLPGIITGIEGLQVIMKQYNELL